MGLGDQIICNAITRHYSKLYKSVFLFVHERNIPSVSFMYRDLKNLKFIPLKEGSNWNDEMNFINSFKLINRSDDHMEIGFNYLNNSSLTFDKAFYEQIKIPFEKRFEEFYVKRDFEAEKTLFNKLNIKEKEYILVCNLASSGILDINFLKHTKYPDAKIVYLEKLTNTIFDWIYTGINALEIHSVDSAFSIMIDSFQLNNDLYLYTVRSADNYAFLKNDWKILIK